MNFTRSLASATAILLAPLIAHSTEVFFSYGAGGNIGVANGNRPFEIYASGTTSYADGLVFDSSGNLYVANDQANSISRVSAATGAISTFAQGSPLLNPYGLAFDGFGNLLVSNYNWTSQSSIVSITPSGEMHTLATIQGGGGGLAINSTGDIFAVNYAGGEVFKVNSSGAVSVFAAGASISAPSSLTLDPAGNLYVSSQGYGDSIPQITRVSPTGNMSTYWTAGTYQGRYLNALVYDPNDGLFAGYGNSILKIDSAGNASIYAENLPGVITGLAVRSTPSAQPVPETLTWTAFLAVFGTLALIAKKSQRTVSVVQ